MSVSPLPEFDHDPRTRIVFGEGTVGRVGSLLRDWDVRRVLVVSDPGVAAAGHEGTVLAALGEAGIESVVFDQVQANPTVRCVEECTEVAREVDVEAFVGLGGGSSMDTAKGCNFLLTNGGRMEDYWGYGKASEPMLPMIAIPTTAGTGSECQSYTLIAQNESHAKMACGDPKVAPRVALLDPVLTLSQPPAVAACSGIDAIAHAVETAVTGKRNMLAQMYSREAFRLCAPSLPRVFEQPGDLDARGRMLLGAAFAGLAIENSMLGAAHSAANPLTAHFGIVHGHAVGIMLPHVVELNGELDWVSETYRSWMSAAGLDCGGASPPRALANHLLRLLLRSDLEPALSRLGIDESSLPMLADEAAAQWTAQFNPTPVDAKTFVELYRAAFEAQLETA